MVLCIVGLSKQFVEVTTENIHLGPQRGLSITGTDFAKRANVLDKTLYLGNFMFVRIRLARDGSPTNNITVATTPKSQHTLLSQIATDDTKVHDYQSLRREEVIASMSTHEFELNH